MLSSYTTLAQHIELLQEKGYLDPNFKTTTQMGYWLKEFEEQFDQCYQQAHGAGEPTRFITTLTGRFNEHLDLCRYSFRYLYQPDLDALSLTSLYAELYQFKKPFYFPKGGELPSALEVYEKLAAAVALKHNRPMYEQLKREFRQSKDPGNDYQAPKPGEKQKTNPWDIQDTPPHRLKIRR